MAGAKKRARKRRSIFEKERLRPSQIYAVADRRFRDAVCLRDDDNSERANGAMYLGGFVVECLLKARLIECHAWLERGRPDEGASASDQEAWDLCYRQHNLSEILRLLPELKRELSAGGSLQHSPYRSLQSVCAEWTIYARYSARQATRDEAREFIARVKEIRDWLERNRR